MLTKGKGGRAARPLYRGHGGRKGKKRGKKKKDSTAKSRLLAFGGAGCRLAVPRKGEKKKKKNCQACGRVGLPVPPIRISSQKGGGEREEKSAALAGPHTGLVQDGRDRRGKEGGGGKKKRKRFRVPARPTPAPVAGWGQ